MKRLVTKDSQQIQQTCKEPFSAMRTTEAAFKGQTTKEFVSRKNKGKELSQIPMIKD